MGGSIPIVGAGSTIYNTYLNHYNNLSSTSSPIQLDIEMELNNEGQLAIFADVELTEDLTSTDNHVLFLMTYRFSNDYFSTVCSYAEQEFNLTSSGETGSFEQAVELNEEWDLADLTAVVLIQNRDNYPVYSGSYTLQANPIIQAAKTTYTGVLPMFRANITEGPSNLGVQFTNLSFPQTGIESFEWDFNGDGEFDLNLEDPYYLFSEPGQYDITLRILVDGEYTETTIENYITVTDGSSVEGLVAGFWSSAIDTYYINSDITIPEGAELAIGPGTNIILNNGSKIIAEGRLAADGSMGDRIHFSSENGWEGIEISGNQSNNILRNCQFSGATNTVVKIDYESDVNILDNVFYNNSCANNTATSIDITSSDNVIISRNVFANNSHPTQTGGIICTGSAPVISNNLFVNNSGEAAMAGAFIIRGGSEPVLTNNTITNNLGNNLIFVHNSNPVFMNSIIQHDGNLALQIAGTLTVSYSCVSGGYEGDGNIDADPLFESPSAGNGPGFDGYQAEWYLTETSPCIDAGNPDAEYFDNEDPDNPGFALYPAMGTLTNDMGAFGGDGLAEYTDSDDTVMPDIETISRLSIYPNPFNPLTNIALQLTEQDRNQPISLQIFNIKGQLIKDLISNQITSAEVVSWNGKDEENKNVSSGMYYVKLKTASQDIAEKVILLK
ncbi:right-handed parallel beta-helix repeat-containing protein [Candidatus Cloacimonadota bacterium]